MKFLFTLLFASFFTLGVNAQEDLQWQQWNEGYADAEKNGKIVLVDMYTDWCGWCKRMDKDTYAKGNIVELINEDFVPVKFNPEEANKTYKVQGHEVNGRELQAMLSNNQRMGYPTTFFIFPDSRQIYVEVGYKNASAFETILKKYSKMYEEANGAQGNQSAQ